MEGNFEGCELRHIGRESNEEVDMLANIGSRKEKIPEGVFLECIKQKSIKTKQTHEPAQRQKPSMTRQQRTRMHSKLNQSRYSLLSQFGLTLFWHIYYTKNCHQIRQKPSASSGDPRLSLSSTANYTREASQGCYSDASTLRTARPYYSTSMRVPVGITPVAEH